MSLRLRPVLGLTCLITGRNLSALIHHPTFLLTRYHVTFTSRITPLLALVLLAGCTTYTYEDGSKETLWGVPTEEETRRYEEDRQAEGVRYRIPGQVEPDRSDSEE